MNAFLNIIVDMQEKLQSHFEAPAALGNMSRQSCPCRFDTSLSQAINKVLNRQPSTMYDDASLYYSFNPSTQHQQEKSQLPKHKRRQSVLDRPNVSPGPQLAMDYFLMVQAGRYPG